MAEMKIMIQHPGRVTRLIAALTLLLVISVRPAHANGTATVPTDDGEPAQDTALVCLALVGGAALLAGGVWIEEMRRMLS